MRMNDLYKKTLAIVALSLCCVAAQAEILLILSQTGSMASATDSIQRGLVQANHQANEKYQLKFVDLHGQSLSELLKRHVNKKTTLIIGPLDKKNVEEMVKLHPKVSTLALNQVAVNDPKVLQFALAKEEDARALTQRIQADGVNQLIVIKEKNAEPHTQSFYDAMQQLWGDKMQVKDKVPSFSFFKPKQGILLLGSGKWLSQQKLPRKHIYTLPYAIEEKQPIPEGMIYCDTPALYYAQWTDVVDAYKQKPVSMPFQRLIAFGGDAWQIADRLHSRKNNEVIEFKGRTGHIRVVSNVISRQPQCFESGASGKVNVL